MSDVAGMGATFLIQCCIYGNGISYGSDIRQNSSTTSNASMIFCYGAQILSSIIG